MKKNMKKIVLSDFVEHLSSLIRKVNTFFLINFIDNFINFSMEYENTKTDLINDKEKTYLLLNFSFLY